MRYLHAYRIAAYISSSQITFAYLPRKSCNNPAGVQRSPSLYGTARIPGVLKLLLAGRFFPRNQLQRDGDESKYALTCIH